MAVRRAETLTGSDWYVAPDGTDSNDLETCIRLEVSGIKAGTSVDVQRRLREKVAQAARGQSNLPAIAAVVGFKVRSGHFPHGRRGMISWAELNKASEEAAIKAEAISREGNKPHVMLLYAKAAELEHQALAAIDPSKIRTKAITAVSAVALWYKGMPGRS